MGGAWCPKPMISQFSYEYLQIDLGKLAVITMVEIQGRFGNGQVGINIHVTTQYFPAELNIKQTFNYQDEGQNCQDLKFCKSVLSTISMHLFKNHTIILLQLQGKLKELII